jgi:5-methylthioadenosine/S-adenosylhomocysteine deaminase
MSQDLPIIIRARWVVPVNPSGRVIHDGAVAINADRIVAVGPAQDLSEQYPHSPVEHYPNHLLMPGLINTHSHAAMALLKGVGDDMALLPWLTERIWPLEGKLMSEQFVFDGAVLAATEMLQGGITCFNDMYFFPQATARAAKALGMRATVGIIVIDFPSAYGAGPDEYLTKGLALRDTYRDDALISFAMAPHAPYTVSDEAFTKVAAYSAELGLPVHCHLHETAFEVQESVRNFGMRPIERLARLGLVNSDLIAVHAVHCSPHDIELLAKAKAHIAHCPHSNLKLASGLMPSKAMLDAGLNITIGTDGSASNNRLDLWGEARTAALLCKGASGDATAFAAEQLIHSLTLGAALALGKQDSLGSLEVGKQADLIAIDLSGVQTQPVFDPLSHLAWIVGREHVQEVWIAGQHVVNKRQAIHFTQATGEQNWADTLSLWHNRVGEILSEGR